MLSIIAQYKAGHFFSRQSCNMFLPLNITSTQLDILMYHSMQFTKIQNSVLSTHQRPLRNLNTASLKSSATAGAIGISTLMKTLCKNRKL